MKEMEIEISTKELRKYLNHKVKYRLNSSGNYNVGIIEDVIRRQLGINGDYIPFSKLKSIHIIQ
jgi:hypothetical protein